MAVPDADMVGLTMVVEGRAKTAFFPHEDAPEIDAAQYETGIGPCLDAFRHQEIFRIDDTAKDDRWKPFSEAAAAHGVRASSRCRWSSTTRRWVLSTSTRSSPARTA